MPAPLVICTDLYQKQHVFIMAPYSMHAYKLILNLHPHCLIETMALLLTERANEALQLIYTLPDKPYGCIQNKCSYDRTKKLQLLVST